MNRRKAILSIILLGGSATAGYSGYKWYQLYHKPNLSFLDDHHALIAALAENIIPETDTPGAKTAMAQLGIISLVKEVADRKTQNIFIDGLRQTDALAISLHQQPFTALSFDAQQQIVAQLRDSGRSYSGLLGKIKNRFTGKSFFSILKQYSSIAFCTSQVGATRALAYDFIPGTYNPCMPITPAQRGWSTK